MLAHQRFDALAESRAHLRGIGSGLHTVAELDGLPR
jgi:hypothetical protein